MKQSEIKQFIEFELKGRWKNWLPTPVEVRDIHNLFEKFSPEQARAAALQYKTENGFEPNIGKIAAICDQMKTERKTQTKIPCFVVYADGMLKTFWHEVSGLVQLDMALAEDISRQISFYLTNENHFPKHGEFVVFVGEQNENEARNLSWERKGVRVNAVQQPT
jgi:hypothetical protein